MKETKKIISIVAVILSLTSTITAFAHPGRLDSREGHKDSRNVSGLGSYHYHCWDSPAHLHTNGVCEYNSTWADTIEPNTPTPQTNTAQPKIIKNYIDATYLKTFINGYEVPTFTYTDGYGSYIIAEDLANYGFDISWNDDSKTVIVTLNNEKALNPMNMDYYNNIPDGTHFFEVKDNSILKVALTSPTYTYHPQSYDCQGYMAIPVDELKMFGTWNWDSTTNSFILNTRF